MRVLATTAVTMATLVTLAFCTSETGPNMQTGTEGCLSWCRHRHNPTESFCCKADPNSPTHHGQCPQRIVANNGMDESYCQTDHHCQPNEKCCFSAYNRGFTCVPAVTNRHQPRTPPPVINARFGGAPAIVGNNFDDLGFNVTYRRGNEGWGSMGDMEPTE